MQKLLKQFEQIKQKGLKIKEDDLLVLINIQDQMKDKKVEYSSAYAEEYLEYKNGKGEYFNELKLKLDDKGKKLYTDKTAEFETNKAFQEKEQKINEYKKTIEKLSNKISTIEHYIIVLRQHINSFNS